MFFCLIDGTLMEIMSWFSYGFVFYIQSVSWFVCWLQSVHFLFKYIHIFQFDFCHWSFSLSKGKSHSFWISVKTSCTFLFVWYLSIYLLIEYTCAHACKCLVVLWCNSGRCVSMLGCTKSKVLWKPYEIKAADYRDNSLIQAHFTFSWSVKCILGFCFSTWLNFFILFSCWKWNWKGTSGPISQRGNSRESHCWVLPSGIFLPFSSLHLLHGCSLEWISKWKGFIPPKYSYSKQVLLKSLCLIFWRASKGNTMYV